MAARDDTDLFMSVRLDDGGRICNVVVSSQTTGQDVVECLKPDDDKVYYLVEIWKGCERPISNQEKLKSVLLQWGNDVDDVTFMLKRKHASTRQKHTQRKTESPRGSPVQFQDQIQEQQIKVESMERELHEKEAYLKAVRSKEGSKNYLKTNYVRHLELKLLEQEEKLKSLRSLQDEHFKCQVDNEKLKLELHRLRSMFALKHEELSDATARVELLTHELAQRSQGDVLKNDHELLVEEMSKNDEKANAIQNELQRQRYVNNQHDRQPLDGSLRKHLLAEHKMPRPTEAQMARLHANMQRNKAPTDTSGRSSSAGNPDGVIVEHVILLGNEDLDSLLSWRDDEENDTETSADSGHVSVDSPSYHNGGIGASFQFNGNGSAKYFEKVERFDMDQDIGMQVQERNARKEVGLIGGNSLTHDLKDLKVSPIVNVVSHQAHSPSKTSAPRGNASAKFPGGQANYNRPLFVQTNNERRSPGPLQFKRTQSNHDSPQSTSSLSSQSSQLSASNSDAEVRGSSPKVSDRERTKLPPSKEPPRITQAGENCVLPAGKEKKNKAEVKETDIDRTAGSISHYQRNRGDCKSPTPKDRFPPRVTAPRGETKGRLSPQVIDPKEDTKDRLSAVRPSNPRVETKDRLPSRVIDPKAESKNRLSPLIVDSKVKTKDRLSSPVTDSKVETSGGETKPRKKTMPGVVRQPVPSAGVQDSLNDIPSLKVTTREVKPLQIQTKAEKDSENSNQTLLVNVTAAKTTPVQSPTHDPKSTVDGEPRAIPRVAPRPVPKKRTKTPPARNSGNEANLVVTSARTVNEPVTNSSEDPTVSKDNCDERKRGLGSVAKEQVSDGGGSSEQKPGTSDVCHGPGTTVGESSLRRKDRKGKKKSGKRVSLDPHAVLLHASLEGELELVKSTIHQVEDPSYPNTEGLTALHHAVCNSHDDIVKFLIEYGCDINAADMQGWTSLHCAAANNGLDISKFLVTHGACVFAVTAIEGKTPSRCCEKDAEHFEECFSYLSDLENNFGVSNDGVVYAVYAYQANRKDELSFECGERLTVIRRGDVTETEWWWARDSRNQFGYIPRNLLGLCPRIAPDV